MRGLHRWPFSVPHRTTARRAGDRFRAIVQAVSLGNIKIPWMSCGGVAFLVLFSLGGLFLLVGQAQSTSKMSGALQKILEQSKLGAAAAQAYAQIQGVEIRRTESGEDRLLVVVESTQNVAALLQAQRGIIQAKYKDLWQVDLPLNSLEPVAAATAVSFIRLPQVAQLTGPRLPLLTSSTRTEARSLSLDAQSTGIISQGVPLIGAQALQNQGITGKGIKVGIIDLGFARVGEAIEAGELPSATITWNCLGSDQPPLGCKRVTPQELDAVSGLQVHGTAVAEIVHDVAPDAELHLFLINTEVELGVAFQQAVDEGVKIINHSVGWFNDKNFYKGKGTTGRVVRDALQNGIFWVNAAGNFAQHHYEGTFQDADSDGFHDEIITLDARSMESGESFFIYFTWDAWLQTDEDLDLFLLKGNKIVASSSNPQNGTEPEERIQFTIGSPLDADLYQLKIQWVKDTAPPTDRRMELFVHASSNLKMDPAIVSSSLPEPVNAPEAFATGAISVNRWLEGVLEGFSSQGPTNAGLSKPDLMGPDCVRTFAYRNLSSKAICGMDGMFPGTSAAAPHVAGAAALLLSQDPSLFPEDLASLLQQRAQPIPGLDRNQVGRGRLDVSRVQGPDLIITDAVLASSAAPQVGQRLALEVEIKNQGEEASGPFWVAAWLQSEALQANRELSSRRVSSGIPPGETQKVTLRWTLDKALLERTEDDQLRLIVVVDAFNDVAEKNEDNNRFEVTVPLQQLRPAELQVSPAQLSFQASLQNPPEPQPVTIRNGGEATLHWSVTTEASWLSLSRQEGTLTGGAEEKVRVSVVLEDLKPGSYKSTIRVTGQGDHGEPAQNSPVEIEVGLNLAQGPVLVVSANAFTFEAQEGSENPPAQTLIISNPGDQFLNWFATESATWLRLIPSDGAVAPEEEVNVQIQVDIMGMVEGTYTGEFTISAPGAQGSPVQGVVTLTITARGPQLTVTPTTLSFSAIVGAGFPEAQSVTLSNVGQGILEWQVTTSDNWILPGVTGGTLDAGQSFELPVFIANIQDLSPGTYRGILTISAPGAKGSPVEVEVTLTLTSG